VFPVRTPEAFHEQLIAMAPEPATGQPNPERKRAFLEKHPETAKALRRIQAQKPTAGFAESTYNALNAFILVDAAGRETKVRWSMVPEPEPSAAPAAEGADHAGQPRGKNFLFETLLARLARGPLKWHLVLMLGRAEDPTNDASVEWPADRERVDVGTLTIDRVEGEATSPAREMSFDPLILPAGIRGSDDPLLSARSAAYAVALRRRAGEAVSPSAVVVEGGK
jgi:catalase